jgi:hypothetical protein
LVLAIDTTILKLLGVPPFIAGVSLAGRRWGPTIGGWLIGLPVNGGVIVFFIALEEGNTFASRTAQASLLGTVSVALFCLAYSRVSPLVRRWYWAMTVSWLVFFASTFGLEGVYLPLVAGFPIIAVFLLITRGLMPKARVEIQAEAGEKPSMRAFPRWDIPLRIITATALVFAITEAASQLGPQLSGLLAPFPVYTTIMTSFTHHLEGEASATRLLRGLVVGLFTFATFFLVLGTTIEALGIVASFGLALAICLAVHLCTLTLMRVGPARRPRPIQKLFAIRDH